MGEGCSRALGAGSWRGIWVFVGLGWVAWDAWAQGILGLEYKGIQKGETCLKVNVLRAAGVSQGCRVGPGGVTWPEWAQCMGEGWAHAWMYKINTR